MVELKDILVVARIFFFPSYSKHSHHIDGEKRNRILVCAYLITFVRIFAIVRTMKKNGNLSDLL
jgi:hypothetical protein